MTSKPSRKKIQEEWFKTVAKQENAVLQALSSFDYKLVTAGPDLRNFVNNCIRYKELFGKSYFEGL